MEGYRNRLQALLKKLTGKADVSFMDYHQIDIETKIEDLDFKKVRGSVRLMQPENVLLPRDTDKRVEEAINAALP